MIVVVALAVDVAVSVVVAVTVSVAVALVVTIAVAIAVALAVTIVFAVAIVVPLSSAKEGTKRQSKHLLEEVRNLTNQHIQNLLATNNNYKL